MPGLCGTGWARNAFAEMPSVGAGERSIVLVAGRHRQQIAHAHRLEVVARLGRRILGKELEHLVVEAQLALGDRQARPPST